MNRRTLFGYFTILSAAPIIIYLAGVKLQLHYPLVWYIRTVDLIDLVVLAPILILTYSLLMAQLLPIIPSPTKRILLLVVTMLIVQGHALHVAANAIHTFAIEARGYTLPHDLASLIHFLDEDLSHIVLFLGVFGLMALLINISATLPNDKKIPYLPSALLGLGVGFFHALGFISAQKVWMIPPLGVLIWLTTLKAGKTNRNSDLAYQPMQIFALVFTPTLLITPIIYWLNFQEFISPFKVMGW